MYIRKKRPANFFFPTKKQAIRTNIEWARWVNVAHENSLGPYPWFSLISHFHQKTLNPWNRFCSRAPISFLTSSLRATQNGSLSLLVIDLLNFTIIMSIDYWCVCCLCNVVLQTKRTKKAGIVGKYGTFYHTFTFSTF